MEIEDYCIELPANGQWQTLISNLEGLSAFEIIGYAKGAQGAGRYSVIHSIAINVHGSGKLNSITNYYSWRWWNKLSIRWYAEQYNNYALQIRTKSNYGNNGKIRVKLKKLVANEVLL